MTESILVVELPFATFGLVIVNGHVVDAAPIARYAVGWKVKRAVDYFTRRGAVVTWTSTERGRRALAQPGVTMREDSHDAAPAEGRDDRGDASG